MKRLPTLTKRQRRFLRGDQRDQRQVRKLVQSKYLVVDMNNHAGARMFDVTARGRAALAQ